MQGGECREQGVDLASAFRAAVLSASASRLAFLSASALGGGARGGAGLCGFVRACVVSGVFGFGLGGGLTGGPLASDLVGEALTL